MTIILNINYEIFVKVADIFNQDNDEEDDMKPKKKLKSLPPPVVTESKKARSHMILLINPFLAIASLERCDGS